MQVRCSSRIPLRSQVLDFFALYAPHALHTACFFQPLNAREPAASLLKPEVHCTLQQSRGKTFKRKVPCKNWPRTSSHAAWRALCATPDKVLRLARAPARVHRQRAGAAMRPRLVQAHQNRAKRVMGGGASHKCARFPPACSASHAGLVCVRATCQFSPKLAFAFAGNRLPTEGCKQMTLGFGRHFVAIPGPSVIPDRVLSAMHRPAPNIYSSELEAMVHTILSDLKRVARTDGHATIYIANGHGAWEAALSNVLSRGDKVLALNTGLFGLPGATWPPHSARTWRPWISAGGTTLTRSALPRRSPRTLRTASRRFWRFRSTRHRRSGTTSRASPAGSARPDIRPF